MPTLPARRALPARPSIEFLRRLAKRRQADDASSLADAQLAVAREHGFTSWRALHAHVAHLANTDGEPPNFFASASAAERYAAGRPYFHPLVIERLAAHLPSGRVARALDVACGTGQSTLALAEIADEVIGADASAAMLAVARVHPRTAYVHAAAETLPVDTLGTFELITVAMGFHWFQRPSFLRAAGTMLDGGGTLAIYNSFFGGRMSEIAEYAVWNVGEYLARFPTPPRSHTRMTTDEAASFGFVETTPPITFPFDATFTPYALVAYLMTQTNVIAAIERGGRAAVQVASELLASVTPLFEGRETGTFPFGCELRLYRRAPRV